jgi:hypothetical protein
MPDESVQRSSRTKQQYEPRRSSRIAEQHQRKLPPPKRKAGKEQQGSEKLDTRAKARKIGSSRPLHSQAQKNYTAEQGKDKTKQRLRAAKEVLDPIQIEQQQPLEENHAPRQKPPPRVAQGLRPSQADASAEWPKPSYLSRTALLQLQSEIANDPLPEEIQQVMPCLYLRFFAHP